jgi:hypothetical protein
MDQGQRGTPERQRREGKPTPGSLLSRGLTGLAGVSTRPAGYPTGRVPPRGSSVPGLLTRVWAVTLRGVEAEGNGRVETRRARMVDVRDGVPG